ncbi:hypothetical protein GCM10027422_08280 [Hymenobacter arcticus]
MWEEIKFDPYRRESGHLVFFQNEGITARRYTFYDAALVALTFRHAGTGSASRQTATQVELHFSAATIELDGIRLEAHSLIPWQTAARTSFRALTTKTLAVELLPNLPREPASGPSPSRPTPSPRPTWRPAWVCWPGKRCRAPRTSLKKPRPSPLRARPAP